MTDQPDDPAALILLTGPTASGKTDTAWELLRLAPPMIFLDCDWFAARTPFSWHSDSDIDGVFAAMAALIDHHLRQHDVRRMVLTLTLEMALANHRIDRHFSRFGIPLVAVGLRCDPNVLRRRIAGRDRSDRQKATETERLDAQLAQRRLLAPRFHDVDTSAADERRVAGVIWTITQAHAGHRGDGPRLNPS